MGPQSEFGTRSRSGYDLGSRVWVRGGVKGEAESEGEAEDQGEAEGVRVRVRVRVMSWTAIQTPRTLVKPWTV